MTIPFVEARWFTETRVRAIDLVVVHDMEYPERLDGAEAVAQFFARGTTRASAHFCIDADSVVQCVKLMNVAWHAPGANHQGIGIEHAGYARQTAAEWADEFSEKMLAKSALLAADLCHTYAIPHAYVPADELRLGRRGITTHADVSRAFRKSDHTDPGPNFPMAHYLEMVRFAAGVDPISQEVRPVVNAPVVTVLSHPSWNGGYVEVAADGGTFSWEAPNYGSAGATPINSPVVDGAVHPSGEGYWLVAKDGGVFSFGNATFHGSTGSMHLNKPIVGMSVTASGDGYWLVAEDGGIFAFGDASYRGSVEYPG